MRMPALPRPRLPLWIALIAVLAGHGALAADQNPAAEPARPNVLLIVADDLGFGDLGYAGSTTRTPHLDGLAQQGRTFTNFHATPVCSVSRGMLLTGNDAHEVGLGAFDSTLYPPSKGKPGYEGYLTRNGVTIAELLRDAGYRTLSSRRATKACVATASRPRRPMG